MQSPDAPVAGTHVPTGSQVTWNWVEVSGATGYKWNTTDNYGTATDMGTNLSYTESGLSCNTGYTRYVWAYGTCGVSLSTALTQSTTNEPPASPVAGTHVPGITQVVWNWNTVAGATGYKWNTTNVYSSAIDMGTNTSRTETGLACNTTYTRYVWAYNSCGESVSTSLNQTTDYVVPASPAEGTHTPGLTQVVWNWGTVSGATGYKWGTTSDYGTAIDMGATTTRTETGLTCGTAYTRYAWAYNACGQSTPVTLSQTTLACWSCNNPLTVYHVADTVAPVDKTVAYGTVNGVPGEPTKCWITNNLGSDHQANAVNDNTEASAGWYWQFNKAQGYKHTGTTRTPNTTWITSISELSNWTSTNDPCVLEVANGFRIPTTTEWSNVDAYGAWTTWNGPWSSDLKLHAAGRLSTAAGNLENRGSYGYYWSSNQSSGPLGQLLYFFSTSCSMTSNPKANGNTLRCIKP
jgi:hypothetical protein